MEIQTKLNYEISPDNFLADSSIKKENKYKFLPYAGFLLLIGNHKNFFFQMLKKYIPSYSWNFYRLFSG